MRDLITLVEAASPTSFGANLKTLIQAQSKLPAGSPLNQFIDYIVGTTADILRVVQPDITEAIKQQSGATPNKQFIANANEAYLNAALALYKQEHPNQAAKLAEFEQYVAALSTKVQLAQQPEVARATTAAIKGIQLNTKGEIGKLDADIERTAQQFAKDFDLKPIWARNLVGMFSISIPRESRVKFLKACENHTAMDVAGMLKRRQGSLDDVVTTKVPGVKDVFASVKDTLLDISLSTGQRGATGPFEAMLAIMGGAKKPAADEGGDVVIDINGKRTKFEVKCGSLSPTSKRNKDGSLPSTGKANEAWLDSTAGKEVSGAQLRSVGNDWLLENFGTMDTKMNSLWNNADFRSSKLPDLVTFLNLLSVKKPGAAPRLIGYMMGSMFPSTLNFPGYDFKAAMRRLMKAIDTMDTKTIAREQGVMALIEYAAGKGNDGFILFNSSVQEYKIIMAKDIVNLLNDKPDSNSGESTVHFPSPMTMNRSAAKCSPGIYFGPSATSARAKEYFQKFNSDPTRVQLRAQAEQQEEKEDVAIHGLGPADSTPRTKRVATTPQTVPGRQRRT